MAREMHQMVIARQIIKHVTFRCSRTVKHVKLAAPHLAHVVDLGIDPRQFTAAVADSQHPLSRLSVGWRDQVRGENDRGQVEDLELAPEGPVGDGHRLIGEVRPDTRCAHR
jgi:hypothetical protein